MKILMSPSLITEEKIKEYELLGIEIIPWKYISDEKWKLTEEPKCPKKP